MGGCYSGPTHIKEADFTAYYHDGLGFPPMFADPIGPWHVWFAWRPIRTTDGRLMWLRRVLRRRCQMHDYLPGPLDQFWQYAARSPESNSPPPGYQP